MVNEFKEGYLYYDKNYPDDIHLCIKVGRGRDMVHFKQVSGEFNWGYWYYYNEEERLWDWNFDYTKRFMLEIGPITKAYRAIYL